MFLNQLMPQLQNSLFHWQLNPKYFGQLNQLHPEC